MTARRIVFAFAVAAAFAACARPAAEPQLEFVEVVTGNADAESPLPLFVGLHGFGDAPDRFSRFFADGAEFPARFVFARGPQTVGDGFAWFPIADASAPGAATAEIRQAAERVARLGAWLAKNRPTVGAPVVFGFSQGGMLSYAIAAAGGDDFRAAVPIAGFLPRELWPDEIADPIPVRAFHGADDRLISAADARATVERLRALGAPAEVVVYDGVGHSISRQMGLDILAALQLLAVNPVGTGTP